MASAAAPKTPYRNLNLGTTGQVVKNAAGTLYGYHLINLGAATAYVKLYAKATAPTSADTPLLTLALAAGANVTLGLPSGIAFASGISVRASTGAADNDNVAPGANEVIANLFYA